MRKTKVDWDNFDNEEVPAHKPLLGPDAQRKVPERKKEIVSYKFNEREKAQAFNKWERLGNHIASTADQARFQEYLKKLEAKATVARDNPEKPYSPPIQQPTPKRAETTSWILTPAALRDEKAISSDDLFTVRPVPILQQLGQKLLALREQLIEEEDATPSETARSGLL